MPPATRMPRAAAPVPRLSAGGPTPAMEPHFDYPKATRRLFQSGWLRSAAVSVTLFTGSAAAQLNQAIAPMVVGPGACVPKTPPADPCIDSWVCVDGGWEPASFVAAGSPCTPTNRCISSGVCNGTGACTGTVNLAAGTVCRPAAGTCDKAETCPGNGANCPADSLQPTGTLCRVAASQCDVQESCDGTHASCPADVVVANGATCATGLCTVGDYCNAGACTPGAALVAGTSCQTPQGAQGVCDASAACVATGASSVDCLDDLGNVRRITVCQPGTSCSPSCP